MNTHTVSPSVLDTARLALASGISVLPIKPDGSKRPDLDSWKQLQGRIATDAELDNWFSAGNAGVAVIGGAVSGGLEVLDFDDADTWEAFEETANKLGCGELLQRIREGYEEITPRGGAHLIYRSSQVAGNTKLAERINAADPSKRDVLIETRGEGGYAITSPSNGGTHPTGNPWKLVSGGVASIATITPAERQILHDLCRSFDEALEAPEAPETHQKRVLDPSLPGDDFRSKHGDLAGWRTILEPHGWRYLFTRSDGTAYWQRPGKDEPGGSATTGYAGTDLLYVFTSSTSFEPSRAYSPFAAYAHLNHNDDFHAAARALADQGYGASGDNQKLRKSERVPETIEPSPDLERMPFPVDCLPSALRELCVEASAAFGYPVDYAALPGMALIGSLVGGAAEFQLKRSWTERGAGWFLGIGHPGSAKSPAQELALRPINTIQEEIYRDWKVAMDDWNELPKAERGQSQPPELMVLMTTDTTIEGVAKHHAHTRGMLVAPDEATSWVAGFNRYRGQGASERCQWLSIWALGQIVVTRASKGALVIPRPTVPVVGGIQPDRLVSLLQDANGESHNDGFLDRILPAWPEDTVDQWSDAEVSKLTLVKWEELARQLRKFVPTHDSHVLQVGPQFRTVTLSDRALVVWKQWFNSNSASTKQASGLARGWAAKAPRHLARIALILHAGMQPDIQPVLSAETLEAAIEITEWFRNQHGLMLSALNIGTVSPQAGLLSRVRRHIEVGADADGWITRTDLYNRLRNVDAKTLTVALDELCGSGVVLRSTTETASKPVEKYSIPRFGYSDYSENLVTNTNEIIRKSETPNQPKITSWLCGCERWHAASESFCETCGELRP